MRDDRPTPFDDKPGDDERTRAAKRYARDGYRARDEGLRAYDNAIRALKASLFLTVAATVAVVGMLGNIEGWW